MKRKTNALIPKQATNRVASILQRCVTSADVLPFHRAFRCGLTLKPGCIVHCRCCMASKVGNLPVPPTLPSLRLTCKHGTQGIDGIPVLIGKWSQFLKPRN